MKTIEIQVTDEQYKKLSKYGGKVSFTFKPPLSPISIIIDALFMESFGVKFKDFDLEKSKLIKKQ